jgi:hypothetical protein
MNLDFAVTFLAAGNTTRFGPVHIIVLGVVAVGLGVYYLISRMKK